MTGERRRIGWTAIAWVAVVAATAPVAAQVERPDSARPSPTDTADADTVTAFRLAPLEVSVLRSAFQPQLVPYAVSALDVAETARARPGLALDEALRGIPGVQVDNRFNYALGERISIRGFGARAQFGVRGVKVVVDGIPATFADGQTALTHVDPRQIERVEVLRGPASTLYGNAAGGVIRLRTVSPPPVPFRQDVEIVAGRDGLMRLGGAAGGRVAGTGYRLNVTRFAYDGFREHSDADKLFANALVERRLGPGELQVRAHAVDYDARNPGSLSVDQLEEDRTQAHGFNVVQGTGESARQAQVGVRWRGDIAGGELSASVHGLGRTLENPIPPVVIDLDRRAGGLSVVYAREASAFGGRALRWTAGLDADAQRDDRRNHENQAGDRGALTLDQLERVRSAGAFLQLSASPAPRLGVVAGLRWDAFRFEAADRLVGPADPDDSGSRTMDAVSPAAGVRYTVAPSANLYANVATSFETPTTTELANRPTGAGGFNPSLEPQRTVSIEAGVKGRVGGRIAYQAAAFRARTRDALIPFEVPGSPGRQFFRNAGSTVRRGVEVGATATLGRGWHARLAYTLLDARFDDYRLDGLELDGNRVPGAAPHRAHVAVAGEAPGVGFGEVEARYSGRVPVTDANDAYSASYVVVNARAELDASRLAGVDVRPFAGVTNLFDAEYDAAVVVNAFGGRYHEPGPGRAAYAGLRIGIGGGTSP